MNIKDKRFKLRSIYNYLQDLAHTEGNKASWDKMFADNRLKPRDREELAAYYDGYMDGFNKAWLIINSRINGHGDFFNKDIPEMTTIGFDRLLGFTKDRFEHYADAELVELRKTYQDDWDIIMKYRKKVANILGKMNKELDERESLL